MPKLINKSKLIKIMKVEKNTFNKFCNYNLKLRLIPSLQVIISLHSLGPSQGFADLLLRWP